MLCEAIFVVPHSAIVLILQGESFCTIPGPPRLVLNLWCPPHRKIQCQKRQRRWPPPWAESGAGGIFVGTPAPSQLRWRKDEFSVPPPPALHSQVFCPHLSTKKPRLKIDLKKYLVKTGLFTWSSDSKRCFNSGEKLSGSSTFMVRVILSISCLSWQKE